MGNYISNKLGYAAIDGGVLIGKTAPSKETKGAFGEVYLFDGELYSCVFSDVINAELFAVEKISEEQLTTHVDNPEEALQKLNDYKGY